MGRAKKQLIKIPALVKKLAVERVAARTAKNWAASDRLRAEIYTLGFDVADTPHGQTLSPVVY